jgi:predicted dehydrogenase
MSNDMKTLRAGVVGAGVFGGYHASKYVALNGVDFWACSIRWPTMPALCDKHGGRAFASLTR